MTKPPPHLCRLFVLLLLSIWMAACATPQRPATSSPAEPVTIPSDGTHTRAAVAIDEADSPSAASGPEPEPGTAVPVTRADPRWGDALAPVTMVVWGDYECPFTARLMGTLQTLQQRYGRDRLRIVWKHNPLPFHQNARPAHNAAETVLRLGGVEAFWRFHWRAFDNQRALTPESFEAWAAEAGVDRAAFGAAVDRGRYAAKIDEDMRQGKAIGVTGTPASFINGVFLSGAQPIEKFQEVIDEQLRQAREMERQGVPKQRLYAELSRKMRALAPAPKSPDTTPPDTTTVWKVPIEQSPVRGKPTALVTIVMFSDLQCPFCRKAFPTVKGLEAKYGPKLRLVFKHNPLPFHPRAEPAAELALEARAQKGDAGFWNALELLHDGTLDDAELEAHARTLGLNAARAKQAIASRTHAAQIEHDQFLAGELNATGTPHFFINGRRVIGAQPPDKFEAIIDEEIARAQKLLAAGTPPTKIYDALQKDGKSTVPERVLAPAPTKDNPSKGAPGAKVTIQVFSDFECPFCKRVTPTLEELLAAYPGKVRLVWRHHPLPMHKHAQLASEAAVEAFVQKGNAGFWAMADKLWELQSTGLTREGIERKAAEIGLNVPKLQAALDAGAHRAAIDADEKIANSLHITGTPTFAINDYYLSGAHPIAKLKWLVDKALGPKVPPTPDSLHGAGKPAAPPPPSAAPPSTPPPSTATGVRMGAKHLLIMFAGSRRAPPNVTRSRDEALARAQQALKKARAGTRFEDLVVQYSDEPGAATRGGDLGTFPKGAMIPEFEQALEKLAVGEISGVVETVFGFHVIVRTQ